MTKALYIHIPFCHDICGYCDFVRVGYNELLVDRYLIELRKDLKQINESLNTIYFGGGTPSALNLSQLELLLDSMSHLIKNGQEITFEANPDSLTEEKIQLLVMYGINRISLGTQSSDDKMLQHIGRTHTFIDVIKVTKTLHDYGLNNVSYDLIYGLPNQTIEDLDRDIDQLLKLEPKHISLYALTIEPHSAFARQGIKEVDNDLETAMYLLIQEKLERYGYIHYEISNYCLPGYESQHNLSYWNYEDFIGVGIGAAGKVGNHRYLNARNINDYINVIRNLDEDIILSKSELKDEHLMMSLRLDKGLNLKTYNELYQDNLLNRKADVISKLIDKDMIEVLENTIKATPKGRLMLFDVLVDLID